MKHLKYIVSVLLFTLFCSCQNNTEADPSPGNNFYALWDILDQKYCFFESKNIDWNGVKKKYEPLAKKVEGEIEMFDLLAQMLDTLQDGHVNIYSPFDISRCTGWFDSYPENFDNNLIYSPSYLGKNYKIAGGLNYNTIADGTVGYIRYSNFSNGFSASNLNYIDQFFKNCNGIIIDVRNNGGGYSNLAQAFASCFFNEKTLVGYIRHKIGAGHNDFSDPQPIYIHPDEAYINWSGKRTVVLTNRRSYSATNDFVSKIRYAKNVQIIGGKTGGGGGMPLSAELPCGWLIRFSAIPTFDREMKHIEFGIEPEIVQNLDPNDQAKGKDSLIETAIAWIKK